MQEHDLIKRFFTRKPTHANIRIGVGDDAAITTIPEAHELVTSIDTMVSGVNFPVDTRPEDIGYKSLAVSLSDMAAMGASPNSVLLSLTLPEADPAWLKKFCEGFYECLDNYAVNLIGGDITKGPLSVTTSVNGFVPTDKAILRSGAKVGDLIYVTGNLGDAGLALQQLQANKVDEDLLKKLNRPIPKVDVGLAIRDFASAAIDISDGLATDLEKICIASNVGAQVNIDDIPLSKILRAIDFNTAITLALTAGDDFELCFTAAAKHQCDYYCIGKITEEKSLRLVDENGKQFALNKTGYEHF